MPVLTGIPVFGVFLSGIPVFGRKSTGIPVFEMTAGTGIFTKNERYFGKAGEKYRYFGIRNNFRYLYFRKMSQKWYSKFGAPPQLLKDCQFFARFARILPLIFLKQSTRSVKFKVNLKTKY